MSARPATLRSLTPYLEVFDMNASLRFYRDELGFEVAFASPEVSTSEGRFPHFVRLARGPAALMLNTAYDADERPTDRAAARWRGCRHVGLYVECDDIGAVHGELAGRGLAAPAPALASYGRLAFSVADPDGHQVVFLQV